MNVELAAEETQQGPGLSDYANVLKRRIWQVLVPFFGLAIAGFGVAFLIPKEYKGLTELEVFDPDAGVASVFTQSGYQVPHKHLLTTINQDVRAVDFLRPLVEQYGITEGYNVADQREKNRLYERLHKRVVVNAVLAKSGTDLVEFEYTGRDAVRVTEFINALRRKWQDDFITRYGGAVKAVEAHVRTVYEAADKTFTEAQTKYRNFQEVNGSDYFGKDPGGQARLRLSTLQSDLETYDTSLKAEEATLKSVTMQLKQVLPTGQTDVSKKRSPDWLKQQTLVDALAAKIRADEQLYTDEWPKLKKDKLLLEDEKAKLEKIPEFQTDSFVTGPPPLWIKLTNDQTQSQTAIAGLQQKIEKTQKLITQLEADVKVIPEKSAQAMVLRDAVDNAAVQLDKALKLREIVRATRDRVSSKAKSFFRVTVEFAAEEARHFEPVWPNYALFAGIGAFIGLLIGGAIAFIGEFTASSFTTSNQVRYLLHVPMLGEVSPLITGREQASRKRRRFVILAVFLTLVVVLTIIHVLYFDRDWRANLPPFIRDNMRRLYGGR